MPEPRTVALVTLGCARNEVDSEELAGRLAADGWRLVDDAADADVAVVNTCGFVDAAKKDSVDALLEANDLKGQGRTQAVVAVGCMAERYGKELAEALPEADGVLGFDDYADISDRLRTILAGGVHAPHTPRDRRKLLPISPAERQTAQVALPGHGQDAAAAGGAGAADLTDLPAGVAPASGPRAPLRRRLDSGPVASVKLASGCDRRCSFCAIPSFRGSFISRRPSDVLGETRWLAEQGVKEVMLVSENNTSYGKDLGDIRLLETLLPELAAVDGIERIRVSYLQPAEMRPGLIDVLTGTPGVVPYFDLSFQHSAPAVLRAMRRFGDTDRFLELLDTIRAKAPEAGVRSNFIVGFPGETESDLAELERFLGSARLDAIGVFGYSDEDGTEAATYDHKLDEDVVAARLARVSRLAEELTAQRAEERLGATVRVLVEAVDEETGEVTGRADHQAPETDGQVVLTPVGSWWEPAPGMLVTAKVTGTEGVDLIAEPLGVQEPVGAREPEREPAGAREPAGGQDPAGARDSGDSGDSGDLRGSSGGRDTAVTGNTGRGDGVGR
ncbi:SSU ribosomal protein S12P methylthiotransferase [Streptomyces sp. DvalAA-14]|uniref:30S ribosomal protein S12 methylthiotransferase RimO n=1 Tax=Streptomyces sp. DvalAA-14 TaxID=1839759 RepID=UPI00081B6226|nr:MULTISPECIES: 30S ribosomal protein S12 methylthiotransferase RimO [unclassified Streptomyces]MYS18720.1 30S ribosomal protein S12 methylthiotransferase RimO [Streptomyces sp. SID4948]SCD28123.1 SSU ribosomal protein S12P methylthiotransferase [Streptomyces sp. DvalAA-14]